MANALMEHETLTLEEIEKVLAGQLPPPSSGTKTSDKDNDKVAADALQGVLAGAEGPLASSQARS